MKTICTSNSIKVICIVSTLLVSIFLWNGYKVKRNEKHAIQVAELAMSNKKVTKLQLDEEVSKLPIKLSDEVTETILEWREVDTKWRVNITRIYENLPAVAYAVPKTDEIDERLRREGEEYFFELGNMEPEDYSPINYLGTDILYEDLEIINESVADELQLVEISRNKDTYLFTYYGEQVIELRLTLKGNEVKTLERIDQYETKRIHTN